MDNEGSPSTSDDPIERLGQLVHDAASVALGLGILGINRVQALRRDLEARLTDDRPTDQQT